MEHLSGAESGGGVVNWDAIRAKGAAGLLTADETDALAELAKYGATHNQIYCWICSRWITVDAPHKPGCPVRVLSEVTDNWRERWEL